MSISIHALREEGDDAAFYIPVVQVMISIHALREEGDIDKMELDSKGNVFLSTPSARRATITGTHTDPYHYISIHALREEGDSLSHVSMASFPYFYPRPPRGGRQGLPRSPTTPTRFLSTPSARRATGRTNPKKHRQRHFYPRPPRGGRRYYHSEQQAYQDISIHALREEGDL